MSVGSALKEARESREGTQEQLALDLNISRQLVSHIETGRRKLPEDIAPKSTERLDCGFYSMEVAHEMTGGSFVGKLNGDQVDLHRSSVKAKALEELEEAIHHIRDICLVNRPDQSDKEQQEQLKQVLIECVDVIVCLSHFVAVICKEYGISWVRIWKDHKLKLKARKYLK
jgi:transcriptional regulator with XRE-family HTH domain